MQANMTADPSHVTSHSPEVHEIKSKFFFVKNLPLEVTREELRSCFEEQAFRIAAIELCQYSFFEDTERMFALVELADINQSRSFYQAFMRKQLKESTLELILVPTSDDQEDLSPFEQQLRLLARPLPAESYHSLFLVGISPLLGEEELLYMLSKKVENAPTPAAVTIFDKNESLSSGFAIIHYTSFSECLEAKRKLNVPHSTLTRFFGSAFMGAIVAEPPLSEFYEKLFAKESKVLKLRKCNIVLAPLIPCL